MPIYEYVCTSCGHEFEAIQKFSDEPLTECACGESGTVERKLSLAAFQLKGGGWYKDRYGAGGGNGKTGNGDSGAAAKSDSKEAGKDSGASASGSEGAKAGAHACGGACSCG